MRDSGRVLPPRFLEPLRAQPLLEGHFALHGTFGMTRRTIQHLLGRRREIPVVASGHPTAIRFAPGVFIRWRELLPGFLSAASYSSLLTDIAEKSATTTAERPDSTR